MLRTLAIKSVIDYYVMLNFDPLIPTFLAIFLFFQYSNICILSLAGHHLVIHLRILVESIEAGASLSIGCAVGEAFVHRIKECFSVHPALEEDCQC